MITYFSLHVFFCDKYNFLEVLVFIYDWGCGVNFYELMKSNNIDMKETI